MPESEVPATIEIEMGDSLDSGNAPFGGAVGKPHSEATPFGSGVGKPYCEDAPCGSAVGSEGRSMRERREVGF